MNDQAIATIRTVVPTLVGTLITAIAKVVAAKYGWTIDVNNATLMVAPVAVSAVTAAYYRLIRALEKSHPKAGWGLGHPGTPTYTTRLEQATPQA